MKFRWSIITFAFLFAGLSANVHAKEPVFEFAEGLRNRGYFDTAEEYLDRIEKDPRISAEIKKRIPYERAITLRQGIREIKSPKQQRTQLDRAAGYLEEFIKNNPGHPLVGKARTDRGRIFFAKAEVSVIELQGPANAERKAIVRTEGKSYIKQARLEFESARADYLKVWKAFPIFIPKDTKENIARRLARRKAEGNYAFAQIDCAKTTYMEAHLYPLKSPELRDTLTKSFKEFDAIHTAYRSMGYGLYSRMWQGKCFEEQGEIGRALGIYNELLSHNGDSGLMRTIQREAMHFKMICLNDKDKNDHLLIDQDGIAWLKRNRRYLTTPTGLGVRFELSRARFALGTTSDKVPPKEKPKFLAAALADAMFVAKFTGKYKMQAALMVDKIKRARGDKIADPKTFDEGFTAATVVYSNVKTHLDNLRKAIAAGKPKADIDKLKTAFRLDLDESARLHTMTQKFYKPGDDITKLNKSRFISAYVIYLLVQHFRENDLVYDGAVLAEFVGKQSKEDYPDQAMDATYLAMGLYIRAYNLAPEGKRQAEMRWIIRTGKFLASNWPGTKLAADASLNVGKLYDKREDYLSSAGWFGRVSPAAKDHYAQSQIYAGLAYWNQYVAGSGLKPEQKVLLAELRKKSGVVLVEGMANVLNPSWRKWKHLEQDRKILISKLTKPKPQGKKLNTKINPVNSPEILSLSNQIKALQTQSIAELKVAATKLNITLAPNLTEQKLRGELLASLSKRSQPILKGQYEAAIAQLDLAQLKDTFSDELRDWSEQASRHLEIGIAELAKRIPAKIPSYKNIPDDLADLVAAKVTLAEYLTSKGEYEQVIQLLTGSTHSVMKVIAVDDEADRPTGGIRGREFAGQVYQQLLRGYVGTQNIEEAQNSMDALEAVASADENNNITAIYEQLGRALQKEIANLRKYDKVERLQKVRDSFKKFLGKLFERKNSLNYNTLIWIAETFYGLGEGMGDSPDAAQYFEKAYSAYKRILEGDTLDEGRQLAVKIRQVNCKRRQGSFLEGDLKQEAFEDALKIAVEVIGKKPLLLRAQTEAAYTLQIWGGNGEYEKHMLSINGVKESNVWGWVGISRKLNGLLEGGELSPADKTEYEHKYLQSRYNISLNRFQYGVSRDPDKTSGKRKAVLDNVLREIDDFATGFGVITGKEFRDEKTGELVDSKKQFDKLYLDAQLEMGRTGDEIVLIEWPKPNVAVKKVVINDNPDSAMKEKEKKKKEEESGSMLGMIFGLLFLVAALGGGGWFLFKTTQQEKNRRKLYATMGSGTASPTPRKQATSKRPSGKTKPRTSKTQPGKTQPGKAGSEQTKPAATRQQKSAQARRPAPGKGQPPSGKKRPDKPAT